MARKKKQKKDRSFLTYMAAIGAILLLSVALFQWGLVGIGLNRVIRFLVGDYYTLICILCIVATSIFLFDKQENRKTKLVVALISVVSAIVLWSALEGSDGETGWGVLESFIRDFKNYFNMDEPFPAQGGLIGAVLYSATSVLIAKEGTWFLIVGLIVLSLLLTFRLEFFKDVWKGILSLFEKSKEWGKEVVEEEVLVEQEDSFEFLDALEDHPIPDEEEEVEIQLIEEPKKNSLFLDIDDIGYGSSVNQENQQDSTDIEISNPSKADEKKAVVSESKPKKPYRLPPVSSLEVVKTNNKNGANEVAAKEKGEKLIRILENFGIKAELLATHIGPSVTKFEIKPDPSVKVSKISGISDNIKMELAAQDIRIEAPIPGRNAVGIEIPNVESTAVRMFSLIRSIPSDLKSKKTLFALGKDLLGQPVYCDMHRMPHLLIAGATGSGKSVCMNTIITSLILRSKPSEVKLLLIDPKKVEFTPYKEIPHLIAPVISDSTEASKALNVIVEMMEERYDLFAKTSVRNIEGYNQKVEQYPEENNEKMPYIIVIIDELADLMAVAGKEVEISIQRITQLARAAGIHLIVATQRPSTDVITGVIKANVPSRIAFSVSSGIDSRTILDSIGAERLLGNGDMLYHPTGAASATRLQGAYVSDEEVRKITEFCSKQEKPMYHDKFLQLDGAIGSSSSSIVSAEDDPYYEEIKEYVIDVQKASTSLIQRRFGIGYNRAARMIDLLEERGIIGGARGSKPREVYVKKDIED